MRKDCGLRYSEQSTVLYHISRLFKGRYLGIEIYGRPSPPKVQEIEMEQRTQKWFSDGLPNGISGFEMKLSKNRRLKINFLL